MLERHWYNTRDGRGGRLREPTEYGECPIWSEDPSLTEWMNTEDICAMYWCARCVLLEDEAFWQEIEERYAEEEQRRLAAGAGKAREPGGGCSF